VRRIAAMATTRDGREPTVYEMTRAELKRAILEAVVEGGTVLVLGAMGFAVLLGIIAEIATH
jgi:hypothetical protein